MYSEVQSIFDIYTIPRSLSLKGYHVLFHGQKRCPAQSQSQSQSQFQLSQILVLGIGYVLGLGLGLGGSV
jgi:hypothetical protein